MENKFSEWLLAEWGRSTALAAELGINRSSVSNAHKRNQIPPRWIPVIVRMAKGSLKHADLIPHSSMAARQLMAAGRLPKNVKDLDATLEALSSTPRADRYC